MLSTVTFTEKAGKTTITVRWSPYEATQKERDTFEAGRDSMKAGWTGTFERLDAYLGQARERSFLARKRNIPRSAACKSIPTSPSTAIARRPSRPIAKILGGEIVADDPARGHAGRRPRPAEWRKKILHARIIGNGIVLMGSDAPPALLQPMKGFSVNLSFKEPEEAERVFNALADRGNGAHGAHRDLLGKEIRHADRQIRHAVDDQLRESGLTT